MYKTEESTILPVNIYVFYKILLLFYPEQYRKRFGQEMLFAFEDMYKEELRKHGKAGVGFFLSILADTTKSVIEQHINMIQRYGMKNYLQNTLHINTYNIIGVILLLPYFFLFATDLIGRVLQGDFSHYNKAFYNTLSHTILYATYNGQVPLLWIILVFAPIAAILLNIVPFIISMQNKKKTTVIKLLFSNPIAIIILGLGFLFIVVTFAHDTIPCFIHHLFSNGLGNILNTISICKNA